MNNANLQILAPDPHTHREAIFRLLEHEWEGISKYGFARINAQSHYDWRTSRIGMIDNAIVTHYGVYDIALRVGTAQVRAAGINMVATHPAYRGQGLMRRTATAALAAMHPAYDLSVVCNAVEDYYAQLGYVRGWPEVHLRVKTTHLPTDPPSIALEDCAHEQQAAFAALYNRDNANITGTAVRPTFPRGKHPGNGRAVRWNNADGSVRGYILFDVQDATHTLWIDDSAGPAEERITALGTLARQFDCTHVLCERLSQRSVLARHLRERGCTVESSTTRGGGWMVQIIQLQQLFEHLAPELEQRLAHAGLTHWQGNLTLASDREQITLHIVQGRVHIEPMVTTPHTINAGRALAQLVVGTCAPDEWLETTHATISGDARWLVPVLFPAQDPQMSNDDL